MVLCLVDSGAAVNLINQHLMEELHLPTQAWKTPLRMKAIDDHPFGKGLITHQTSLLTLQVSQLHAEES